MSYLWAVLESLGKRRKQFLWLGAVVVVNLLAFVLLTHRLANKQERLVADRERLGLELQNKKGELEELSDAAQRAASNAAAVTRFWDEVVRPRVPGLTEAWDEIDRLADDTHVSRGRTGYQRELLEVGLEQVNAAMPVEGSYFDLVRFINRLERSERFFLLEQVRLSQQEQIDATIRLDCSIAFFLRDEAPGSSAGP